MYKPTLVHARTLVSMVAVVALLASFTTGSISAPRVHADELATSTPVTDTATSTDSPLATDPTATTTEIGSSTPAVASSTDVSVVPAIESTSSSSGSTDTIQPVATATLSTDQDNYHPGSVATIFGNAFTPLQEFLVKVFGSDENDQQYTESVTHVTSDSSGAFSTTYSLDSIYRPFYDVVASTLNGETLAHTLFRDSSVGTYDQCANDDGDGYASGDTGCRWTNGNLQSNNSTYHEGDSTVQRVWIKGYAPGSTHTLTFQYDTTKGGKHAYDFLTSWNASESWITEADLCQAITGCVGKAETTTPVPHDPNGSGAYESGTRNFVMRGGTLTGASSPTVSGSYAGDSDTSITVTFTVDPSGSMCSTKSGVTSCDVALFFGAHISKSSDWGAGTTAVSISGSPYHVALAAEDGASIGQRDNQMQANAIVLPNTITIHKIMVGGTDTFTFTGTPSGTISTSTGTLTASPASGAGSVTESTLSGWNLTGLTCATSTGGATATPNLGTRTVNYSMPAAGGGVVDCTFTNTRQQAHLTLVKAVVNDNGGTASTTDWTLAAVGPTSLSGSSGTTAVTNAAVDAGTYSLSESGGPTGYASSTWSCVTNGGAAVPGSSLTLGAGDTATCTITNDDIAPSLTLVKQVSNTHGGTASTTDWTLSATGSSTISGAGGATSSSTFQAGTYTLAESTGPAHYTPGDWVCAGDVTNSGTSITLGVGQSAICTITNSDEPAHLTVIKHVVNDNGGTLGASDFTMQVTGTGVSSASFPGAEASGTAITLDAGSYNVDEASTTGYAKTIGTDCSGTIAMGESKTCTITNNDIAPSLTLNKITSYTHGGTAPESSWTLTADGGSAGTLSGPGAPGSTDVVSTTTFKAGTYSLSESAAPTGYANGASFSCIKNGAAPVLGNSITLAVGDMATCSITNTDIAPSLTVIKHVINDDGDTAVASDFTMHVTGTNVSTTSFTGSESGVTVSLNAGSYTVDEVSNAGYAKTLSADCSGTIAVGESKTCTITNNDLPHATRTLGFWQTHTAYTTTTFGSNDWLLGTKHVDSVSKLLAGFYASIPKTTTNTKRSALDQARMQMLQQWLAAKLNCTAFGCSIATQTLLTNAATAWSGTSASTILSYASQLDAYNNSNDALPISAQGKATPSSSQTTAAASLSYWNVLP